MSSSGHVVAVCRSATHSLSKATQPFIELEQNHGVRGDVHAGATVKHRSRVRKDPTRPNLRQVHLIGNELLDELTAGGRPVEPGRLGENITTEGLDLLALSAGTRLHVGHEAILEVTGLRNPCAQLETIHPGLQSAVLDRDADGNLVRRAGIMAIVVTGGRVTPGDTIRVEAPERFVPLDRV